MPLRRHLVLALLLCVFASVAARADTIFSVNGGSLQSGGPPISGVLGIDPATGLVTSIDAFYLGYEFVDTTVMFANGNTFIEAVDAYNQIFLELALPVPSLVGYSGGPLLNESIFLPQFGLIDYADGGSLTPVAATVAPEPASWSFLLMGLAGLSALRWMGRSGSC